MYVGKTLMINMYYGEHVHVLCPIKIVMYKHCTIMEVSLISIHPNSVPPTHKHTHLQVPRPPVKPLLWSSQHRLVIVVTQQLMLRGCQRPNFGPFVHICHPGNQLESFTGWGSIPTQPIIKKRLEKLSGSWVGNGVRVPPRGKGEKVDDGAPLAIVGTEIRGVVEGDLEVDDEQWYKATCCCLC